MKSLEKKNSDKELMHSTDRALLLACVYFDQSHAGYLLDKDVEDIIHTTGLQLSRAQVSRLVSLPMYMIIYKKLQAIYLMLYKRYKTATRNILDCNQSNYSSRIIFSRRLFLQAAL